MKKILLLTICLLVFSYSQAANDRAFSWEVSTDRVTVYLLGSIHYADRDFYPLRPAINNAFKRSENLVVELDVTAIEQAVYKNLLLQKGVLKDGKTVRDVISDETWFQLEQRLKALNIDYQAIKHYKPGVLVMQLTAMQLVHLGFDPQFGIDVHFLREARAQSKNIIELETLEQQMNLFLDVPDENLLLQESLYSLNESEQMMSAMVDAWKKGDEIQMSQLLFEDAMANNAAFPELYNRLIFERNRQMTARINKMLQQKPRLKTTYFIVVGAGHLIGNKGIIHALKQKGYSVKRF